MYIIIYKNEYDELDCDYVSFVKCNDIINKYKSKSIYCFKYDKGQDILYINYPLKFYYKTDKINQLLELQSDEYLEIRLGKKYPHIRKTFNIDSILME